MAQGILISPSPLRETRLWLEAAWHTLKRLHDAGIAHGSADMHGFVVTDGGVACIDLVHACLHATPADRRHDVAELLAVQCRRRRTGRSPAVRRVGARPGSARRCATGDSAARLSGSTRASFRWSRRSLDELRARIAYLGGVPTPPAERPMWVASRNLAPLALGTFALVLLLSQAGSFRLALDVDVMWIPCGSRPRSSGRDHLRHGRDRG